MKRFPFHSTTVWSPSNAWAMKFIRTNWRDFNGAGARDDSNGSVVEQ